MAVIDAHSHFFPEVMHPHPTGWARDHGETHFARLMESGSGGSTLQGWASPEAMLRQMDAAGIDRALLLGWYWQNPDNCVWHNAAMATLLRDHPDRFLAFAACHPGAGVEATRELLEVAGEAGFRGVGELFPQVQGFTFNHPAFGEILDFCTRFGWPINFHVTEAAGHAYPGRVETPLQDLVYLASIHPRLDFVFSHWGGGLPFFELNPKIRAGLARVYYDTAASPLLYDPRIHPLAVQLIGPGRILWGTDFPLRVFPRQDLSAQYPASLAHLRSSGLDPAHLPALLGGNLARLLRLPA